MIENEIRSAAGSIADCAKNPNFLDSSLDFVSLIINRKSLIPVLL